MQKKSLKKTMLMVLVLVLVCLVSVGATLAYLTAHTGAVTNTFVVGQLFNPPESSDDGDPTNDIGLFLKEHKATHAGNGVYNLGTEEVDTNTYSDILPGVNVAKDPFVRVNGLKVDAYLFIEVAKNLQPELSYAVDDSKWEATTLAGKHGGTVYKYKGVDGVAKAGNLGDINILKNQQIVVAPTYSADTADQTLTFYAYIIQSAGFNGDVTAAWAQVSH